MLKLDFKPPANVLRQFAFIAVVGLPLLAALVLRFTSGLDWTHPAILIALGIGAAQLGLFMAGLKEPTRCIYVLLMIVAFPIGFVISHVMMLFIYYLVITPIALVFRVMGRDVLGRRLEPQRASYWTERGKPRNAASYFKLY